PLLLVVIARQHGVSYGEERGRTVAADHGAQALELHTNATLLRGQPFDEIFVFDGFGGDGLAWRAIVGSAEDIEISLDPVAARQRAQKGEAPRLFDVVFAAARKGRGDFAPFRRSNRRIGEELFLDVLAARRRFKPEPA